MLSEWTLTTILNRLEDLSITQVYKFNKQECINSKPTLQAGNEELKEYNCEIKLHANFCNPKKVIDILKKHQESREPFEWIYRGEYKGSFVIEKLEEQEVTRVKDVLIFARISFTLLEVPQNTEFAQQIVGESDLSKYEQFGENSNRLKEFAVQVKNSITENMKETIINLKLPAPLRGRDGEGGIPALSENLSDAAQEVFEQVKNGVINDISNGQIANIYDTVQNYSNVIERGNLQTSDVEKLIRTINSLPQRIIGASI